MLMKSIKLFRLDQVLLMLIGNIESIVISGMREPFQYKHILEN